MKKGQKLYFWDWTRCSSDGARFENMIALHLLRFVHWARDIEGQKLELRFFRNRLGHEVDFVLLRDRKPYLAIEAKLGDWHVAPGLVHFIERLQPEHAFQVVLGEGRESKLPDIGRTRVQIVSAKRLPANLP